MARILLIDDNASGSALRAKVLERHGHQVQLALDGANGLALAVALQPDLVLLDHTLPDRTGAEVNALLREALPDLKVISFSGYTDAGIDYDPAPDAILTKGDSVVGLIRTIAELTR